MIKIDVIRDILRKLHIEPLSMSDLRERAQQNNHDQRIAGYHDDDDDDASSTCIDTCEQTCLRVCGFVI